MNHEEQLQFRQDIQQYIMSSNVNNILQSLLEDLMINKPSNPIDFMINKLQKPEREFNFVIGPPGLRTFNFLEKVRQQMTTRQFQVFNCGQFILQTVNQLSEQVKNVINNGLLIKDQQVNKKILSKIKDLVTKSQKSIIIQGYPKNLDQATKLQKELILPTKIIIMNVNDQHLKQICQYKITSNFSDLSKEQIEQKVTLMMMQYKTNLKQLKEFYNKFTEIDLSRNSSEPNILKQLRRAFEVKTTNMIPRTYSQVLVIGAPNSGRTTLAKSFAKYYNLVYVSTKALISNQIRKDTITGRKIKDNFINNELIDQFTIQKLIEDRINQKDCLMQGFVLQGYPKTQQQYENMKNLNIRPTLTVVIDLDSQQSIKRGKQDLPAGKKRFEKWVNLRKYLETCLDKMFWVDPYLNQENMFEQVKYQFEKKN